MAEEARGSSDAGILFESGYRPQRGPTSKPRVLPGEQINPPKPPRTPTGCNIIPPDQIRGQPGAVHAQIRTPLLEC